MQNNGSGNFKSINAYQRVTNLQVFMPEEDT